MDQASIIREIALAEAGRAGALLPILVAVNRRFGHVPQDAEEIVADALNISRADVAGVIAFYEDFRRAPPGRTVVQVCRAEACQAAGGAAIAAHAEARLGCGFGEMSADGAASLEAIYCFGNCALAPAARIGDHLIGRATPATFDAALADGAAEA